MSALIVNYATGLAFFALAIDIILQIRHIWRRKSSADISIFGVFVRTAAASVFLIKFTLVNDAYLIMGQAVFVALLLVYIGLLVAYRETV
jgi:uncharacterized protein with PQ loop repeat